MRELKIDLNDVIPLIKEKLDDGGRVNFSPRGISMLPLLVEGRDSVTLISPPERLKRFDVALYQREGGQYVLHRVVRIGETYTFIGDNQFVLEPGIAHSQIIAVCTAFTRKGKTIDANSLSCRLYAIFWHYSRFPRRVWRAVARRVRKIFGKNKSKG